MEATDDVTVAQVASWYRSGRVSLLDVREDDEWDSGHIDGATHVPLRRLHPAAVDRNRPIVAVCHSGHRSAVATAHLRNAGLTVHNLTGGMVAWLRAGLPVVASDGRPGTVY